MWGPGWTPIYIRGWLDQAQTDFLKGRSLALDAGKRALEDAGFALPEPIYRLRFDETAPLPLRGMLDAQQAKPVRKAPVAPSQQAMEDAAPDTHIEKMVAGERAQTKGDDLLDNRRPIE